MLLMNLESRPVIFEDVARQVMLKFEAVESPSIPSNENCLFQVLAQDERKRPEEYIDRIAAVEAKDINRIADRMLSSRPSVAAIGDLVNFEFLMLTSIALQILCKIHFKFCRPTYPT